MKPLDDIQIVFNGLLALALVLGIAYRLSLMEPPPVCREMVTLVLIDCDTREKIEP